MVGNQILSFINTRLQQLTGTKAVFGGLSVIAAGDLYQLKPVGEFLYFLIWKRCILNSTEFVERAFQNV